MNFKNLNDDALDLKIESLIHSEREILAEILKHFQEAESRRLYSKYGYKSLFEYAVKRFGYSEDEAYRRISAMHLLKDIPQIASKIEDGVLSLTNLTQAQTFFRQEKKAGLTRDAQNKIALLEKIEGCSKREALPIFEREAKFALPGLLAEEDRKVEMAFMANLKLQEKLKRLMDLKSKNSLIDLEELIEQMTDLALEKWDPLEKAKRQVQRSAKISAPDQKLGVKDQDGVQNTKTDNFPAQTVTVGTRCRKSASESAHKSRPAIAARVKHAVTRRDGGKCYNCGSTRHIEFDHVTPYAQGGLDTEENLRLLCRSCNQRHAIEIYGVEKMSRYLN